MSTILEPQSETDPTTHDACSDPLWNRLSRYQLDIPDCGLTFSERAAKENAWTVGYTQRVMEEYKRFLFLAMRCGHVACPSEDVDQIWHMHLCYTRSYWDELCKDVLQHPLHHGPTQGGSKERVKYYQLYERTKESYERWFHQSPPNDIWPTAEKRFGEDLHYVRINAAKHWIIPKLGWRHLAVGAGSAGLIVPIAQLAINPLDWSGPEFIMLFVGLIVAGVLFSWIGQRLVFKQQPGPMFGSKADHSSLAPIDVAWLRAGDQGAMSCALVDLAQADAIELDLQQVKAGPKLGSVKPQNRVASLILNSVQQHAPTSVSMKQIYRDGRVGLVALKQELQEKGLASTFTQKITGVGLICGSFGVITLMGAAKIWVGAARSRPVGILVFLELFAILAACLLLVNLPRITETGRNILRKLQDDFQSNPEKLPVARQEGVASADSTLLWGAAILGSTYLASTAYADFGEASIMRQMQGTGSSSGGCGATGCGGDTGCGGGGGGCGGGGCGGCGGCGG